MVISRNRRGALSVPLLLSLLCLCLAGFGTWGVLRNWRRLVELQLRLDRCAARAAIQLRDSMRTLEATNREMTALRAAIQAAVGNPPLLASLETALLIEFARQEFARKKWDALRVTWISRLYCQDLSDRPRPLPELRWIRDPPDQLGPRPLRWPGPMPREFRIQIGHSPRHAAARVSRKGEESAHDLQTGNWRAHWAAPLP